MANKKAQDWKVGTVPYSKHQVAQALANVRERVAGNGSEVNLTFVLYEVSSLFKLADDQMETVLGKDGLAAVTAKISGALWT